MSGVYATRTALSNDLRYVGDSIELSYDEFDDLFDGMDNCRKWADALGCSVEVGSAGREVVFVKNTGEA